MKRMIAFFMVFSLLIGIQFLKEDNFKSFAGYEKIVLVSDEKYIDLDSNPISCGEDYFHKIDAKNGNKIIENIYRYKYKGISFYFDKAYTLKYFNKVFNNTLYLSDYGVDDYEVYYGYYSNFKDFRLIDGKKINVQLVITKENCIVGMPLVLTGF